MVPIDPLQPVATGSYWKAEKMNTASWHMKDQIIGLYFDACRCWVPVEICLPCIE
jgi:hypothetical protein